MIDELAFKRWLQHVTDDSGSKIRDSHIFISLFTAGYEREPQCALQLGIAVMLDKPIYIAAPTGTKIPENIKRLARKIEFFDPNSPDNLKDATKRLFQDVLPLRDV